MRAGKLKHKIIVQARSATKDTYGQRVDSWTDIATVWADIRPIGGRERLAAKAYEAVMTHTVAVRYRAEFLPVTTADSHRIVFGARTFQIVAAMDHEEARKMIIFDCVEGPADG